MSNLSADLANEQIIKIRPDVKSIPFYQPVGNECDLFESAYQQHLPLLIKGPTGCGKTRFIAHMAARLGRPLHTVSCHDDLTAADLTGQANHLGVTIQAHIVATESGLAEHSCMPLIQLAQQLRTLKDVDLEEVVSTRLLIYCAVLIKNGLDPYQAAEAALVEPLCDDPDIKKGLLELVRATYGS